MPRPQLPLPDMFDELNDVINYLYSSGNTVIENIDVLVDKFYSENSFNPKKEIIRCKFLSAYGDNQIKINYEGIKMITDYGSYKSYMLDWMYKNNDTIERMKAVENKSKARDNIEFILKNTTSIVAILLSLSSVVVALVSIFDKRELRSLEQELRQLKTAQDTLILKLSKSPIKEDTIVISSDQEP